MSKFIHNKSTGHVSLINGKFLIPIGDKVSITDQEAQHEDVIHASRLGWISIEGDKSKTASPKAVGPIEMAEDELKGSETIPVISKKEAAFSSPLGGTTSTATPRETTRKKTKKI